MTKKHTDRRKNTDRRENSDRRKKTDHKEGIERRKNSDRRENSDRRKSTDRREDAGGNNYFTGQHRYYDSVSEHTVVKVFSGDCYSTDQENEVIITILGSCVAVCMRDPIAKVGGMNHFLLPENSRDADSSQTRYGAFAMETLINDMLKKGAQKQRFEVKVFGGGNVIKSSAMIGDKNVQFIRKYLKDEGLKISQEHLGGNSPRRIHYYPDSGKVMMRKLGRKEDLDNVVKEESTYSKTITKKADTEAEGNVELF